MSVSSSDQLAATLRSQEPVFESVEEERLHRKQRLAAGFRLFSRFGFDEGIAGHITVRDPEWSNRFWVNPIGMHFSEITVSSLVLVDEVGNVVQGQYRPGLAAFSIHSAIHRRNPMVVAAAHTHSVYGRTWSSLGRLLEPITQDACAFFEDHAVYREFGGVALDSAEGDSIASSLGDHKAVILQNHGLLTVGRSVDEAVWWFVAMERSAQSQLMAEAAGAPIAIQAEIARMTAAQVGASHFGWRSFQPLYARITREQPELLE
jgi:ribulose-5-phosphate 4-epimerase/fuculose-1-phosphate aldolase